MSAKTQPVQWRRGRPRRRRRARPRRRAPRSGMAMAATVPPSGTAICRTPSAHARREAGYARNSALVPAMGTTAVPTPKMASAAINSQVVSTTAARGEPRGGEDRAGQRGETAVQYRSTAIPAAISASPEPNRAAVSTAPSSARVKPYALCSSGPTAGRPKLTNKMARFPDGGGGEHGSCGRALRHRWIIVGAWNSARSPALASKSGARGSRVRARPRSGAPRTARGDRHGLEGPNVDEETFARMDPEDVEIGRQTSLTQARALRRRSPTMMARIGLPSSASTVSRRRKSVRSDSAKWRGSRVRSRIHAAASRRSSATSRRSRPPKPEQLAGQAAPRRRWRRPAPYLARPVVWRRHLDHVGPHERDPLQRAEELDCLRGGEARHFGRARSGRIGRVEEVDVEGEEDRPVGDALAHELAVRLGAESAKLLARDHVEAERAAVVEVQPWKSGPRMPACTDAIASISPSSTARRNVVPWK